MAPGELSVVGAGFGRTGTYSLKLALEELGYAPCYHMAEVVVHSRHQQRWLDAYDGKPVDWRKQMEGYQAAVDFPACAFYKEILAAHPEAKVILTTRDPERWYRSCMETIFQVVPGRAAPLHIPWYLMPLLGVAERQGRMVKALFTRAFGSADPAAMDPEQVKAAQLAWAEEVVRCVPPGQLLPYQVSQGWEPLCAFLGKPVPNTPFPHVNDTKQFNQYHLQKLIRVKKVVQAAKVVVPAVTFALLGAAVMAARKRLLA